MIGGFSTGVTGPSKEFSGVTFRDLFPSGTTCRAPRPTTLSFFAASSSLNIFLHCSEVSRAVGIKLLSSYECTRFRKRSRECEGRCTKLSSEAPRRTSLGLSKQFWHKLIHERRSEFMHTMHWYRLNVMSFLHISQAVSRGALLHTISVSSQAQIAKNAEFSHNVCLPLQHKMRCLLPYTRYVRLHRTQHCIIRVPFVFRVRIEHRILRCDT